MLVYVTDFGFVAYTAKEKRAAGASFKRNGMPANLNAWVLRDFLTYFTFDCFKAATDPNEGIDL